MDLWRWTTFIQRRGGWVFLPVVVWRRPPFAKTGRLFASGYSVLIKYLGMYGLIWAPSYKASQSRWWKRNNIYSQQFSHWFIAWFVKNHESYGHEHCHFCLAFWVWHHEGGWCMRHQCILRHKPIFFCCSLVKNEPTRRHSEKLKFEVKKVLLLHTCWEQTQMMPANGNTCTFVCVCMCAFLCECMRVCICCY